VIALTTSCHRDVHDGHCPTGAARPELLSKDTRFSRRNRGVVKPARINGDPVPTVKRVGGEWREWRFDALSRG
jgi:hypothetical protein